jgi:translation initiation factor 1
MHGQRIVYSTDKGRTCPECARPVAECRCKRSKTTQPAWLVGDGIVRVGRETKGRKGKGVTIVSGIPATDEDQLLSLAKKLKQLCGCGGRVAGGRIEIQGDHRDRLIEELQKLDYTVKRSGG